MSSVSEKRTSKEYNFRPAVNPGQQFQEFIRQIPDKAIADQGKQKHSEFKKPYLADSYEDMDYTWEHRPVGALPDYPVPSPSGVPTGAIPKPGDIPNFPVPSPPGSPQYRVPPKPGDGPHYPAPDVAVYPAPDPGDEPNLEFPRSPYYPVPKVRIPQIPVIRRPGDLPSQLSGWAERHRRACGKGMRLYTPASVTASQNIKVKYYGGHDNSDAAHQNEYVLDMYSVERNGKTYYEQSTWEVGFGYSSFGITFDNDGAGEATLVMPQGDVTAVTVAIWPKENWSFMERNRKMPCLKKRVIVGEYVLKLYFEGVDGDTTWVESAQGLTPTSVLPVCEIDTAQYYKGVSSLKMVGEDTGVRSFDYIIPGIAANFVFTSYFRVHYISNNGDLRMQLYDDDGNAFVRFQLYRTIGGTQKLWLEWYDIDYNLVGSYDQNSSLAADTWHKFQVICSGKNVTMKVNNTALLDNNGSMTAPLMGLDGFAVSFSQTVGVGNDVWLDNTTIENR